MSLIFDTKKALTVAIILLILLLPTESIFAELIAMTPLELYNSSEIILVGKVISLREDPSQHETEYDIRVEQYLKNPKPYSLITAVGAGTKSAPAEDDPLFDQGDRVLLYLNQQNEKYLIHPFSFKATSSCDPSSLLDLDLNTIQGQRPPSGIAGSPIRTTNLDGNESNFFSPQEKVIINFEAFNSHPHNETFDLQIFIAEINKTEPIFKQEQQITLDACDGHVVTWDADQLKVGDYEVTAVFDEKTYGYSFSVRQNMGCCSLDKTIIESPLKQFKSGISPENVLCKEGLQLVVKTSNGNPACVKQSSISKLFEHHWGLPYDKLTVYSFNDSANGYYVTGQEIVFTIRFEGIAIDCSYPNIIVKDHDDKTVWQSNHLVLLCDSDAKPHYSIKEWKVGHSDLGDLIINNEGDYTMKVEYGKYSLEKDFRVTYSGS